VRPIKRNHEGGDFHDCDAIDRGRRFGGGCRLAPAGAETLFKIVTVKDDIVVGLNDAELKELGGDAGAIAKAIAAKGSLALWQYAVTQKDGERMVAPRAKIGVLANASLRVEPYKQPFKVLPHE
jgi:hypothetical protein